MKPLSEKEFENIQKSNSRHLNINRLHQFQYTNKVDPENNNKENILFPRPTDHANYNDRMEDKKS